MLQNNVPIYNIMGSVLTCTECIISSTHFAQDINLYKLPLELYDGENTKVHENGLRHFTMLYQYLQIINTLEMIGLNSTDLTLFRLLIEQLLTDTCNWVSPQKLHTPSPLLVLHTEKRNAN